MDTVTRSSSPDVLSRVLSVLSLLTALAVGGYVYYQQRSPSTQLVGAFDSELAEHASRYTSAREELTEQFKSALDRQDKRMEEWNSQLVDAIEAFRQDGEALLKRLEENERIASQQRHEAFRAELAQLEASTAPDGQPSSDSLAGPSNQAAGNSPETALQANDASAASSSSTARLDPPPTNVAASPIGPRLRLVNTALRPGSADPTLLVIENEGDSEAVIERVRFRPESEYDVGQTSNTSSSAPSDTVTILYEPRDNTSQREGYHGIYDRRLTEPVRVPPGGSVTLRIVIQDARFEGFGFEGRLALDYNGSEQLMVDTARVMFRASEG